MENTFISKQERQKIILKELEKSNENIKRKDLALKFDVSERTITRDINSLIEAEYNIIVISGASGGYKIRKRGDGYQHNK